MNKIYPVNLANLVILLTSRAEPIDCRGFVGLTLLQRRRRERWVIR